MKKYNNRMTTLDISRFIAAFAVLIYHYKSKYIATLPADSSLADSIYMITKFGYLGVDFFFLISGFVVFSSSLNRTPTQFLISRTTRIFPTLWVCLIITSVMVLISSNTLQSISVTKFLANSLLLHEYLGINSIDGVYWTLVTEIKFYACIFILSLTGLLKHYKIWLSLWLIMTISFFIFEQPFFLGWFISPYYSPYFISGIIFYLMRNQGYSPLFTVILLTAYVLALVNAYEMIETFSKNISQFDRIIAMGVVSCFYLLFYLFSLGMFEAKHRRLWMILGGMTYPIYLIHNVAGKLMYDQLQATMDPLLLLILITMVVCYTSFLIHTKFEKKYANKLKMLLLSRLGG